MNSKLNYLFSLIYIGLAIFAQPVFAANRLGIKNLNDVVKKLLCPITDLMFAVLMIISIIMVLYAAYIYLTSSGDTTKISTATKTITYAAIAVAVALVAKNFPYIIAAFFGATLGGSC